DRESYAKEVERIEYNGTLLHHKVIRAAIKEMKWTAIKELNLSKALDIYFRGETLDRFRNTEKDFEVYWNKIKNSPHADYHRKAWDRAQPGISN
ncbi:MAG: hypothetical protein AAF443_05970, partial [Chlamydiota bacterium]